MPTENQQAAYSKAKEDLNQLREKYEGTGVVIVCVAANIDAGKMEVVTNANRKGTRFVINHVLENSDWDCEE